MLRTIVLAAVAGLVIAADWLRFEEPRSGDGRAFALVALAIAPALLRPLWLRLAGVALSAMLGVWVAFSVSPFAVWPGGDGYFGPLGSRFGHGLVDFYDFRLPFDPVRHPQSHQVILAAIFGFSLAVALAVGARRPLLAVVCVLVGAGWPVTVLAGGDELSRGVVILAVALALLAGLAERPSQLAFVASAAVIVGALALSSSPAVAKPAFLDWEQWDFYTRPQNPVSVRYIWDARYDGVRFPKKQTTVLTIRGPQRSNYWRATVLDQFDGTRWLERLWRESTRESQVLLPAGARDRERWLEQEVTVHALQDDHLIGATIPVAYDVDGAAREEGQGVVRVPAGLQRDQRYLIWSYAPRPTPAELARVRASYPRALTKPGRELDVADGITVPPLGATGRDLRLAQLLTGRLESYSELYDRARAVVGETSSPYAAVIALETWFRTTGGFTYSEQPGSTPGLPPLVGFVEDTKTGYCQHFAGAMAVMLRLLGVPARVAAGFVPGKYRDGTWRVTDHQAHAWVEVWLRGYGWLPFDPTPGRGRVSGSYSSTSLGFNAEAAARLLAGLVRGGELFGESNPSGAPGPPSPERLSARDTPFGIGAVPAAQERKTPSLILFLLLLSAGIAAVIVLLKQARRRLRYLTRDPRRIAAACGRDLTEFLQDQRLGTSRAATFHELAEAIAERLGVDARRFARVATVARYGPPGDAHGAARRARRELRVLKALLRGNLPMHDRVRGLVSVRSLGLG